MKKDLKNFHFFKSFFKLSLSHFIERGENRMQKIIRWFVMLLYKDMQNFEMDNKISKSIYNKIMKDIKKEKS